MMASYRRDSPMRSFQAHHSRLCIRMGLTAAVRRRVIMMWADCAPRVTGQEVQIQDPHAYSGTSSNH